MYRDPVFTLAGHTYERAGLETFWATRAHMGQRQYIDPNTNQPLLNGTLIPNWDKRKAVSRWLELHPAATPDGWDARDVPAPRETARERTSEAAAIDAPVGHRLVQRLLRGLCSAVDGQRSRFALIAVAALLAWIGGAYSGGFGAEDGQGEGVMFMLIFSALWNCFVAVWTFGATVSGAPILFPLFSVPFWAAGGALASTAAQSLLQAF
jgi:hypothetical protein